MILTSPFRDRKPRLIGMACIVGCGLLLLLGALFYVQVMQAQYFGNREQAQSLRRIRLAAARGEIVDRNGVVLANNRPSFDAVIYLDQLSLKSKRQDIVALAAPRLQELSALMKLPVTVTDDELRTHYQRRRPLPLPVWRDLTTNQVAVFAESASSVPGSDLLVTPVRQYPLGATAAHLLGYVGRAPPADADAATEFSYYQPENIGKQGVERTWDEMLRGEPGGRTIRVNPSGQTVGEVRLTPAERGARVELTIDVRLQQIVEEALRRAPVTAGKEVRGAAVMLDPRTGEILALASVPTFDPNLFSPGVSADAISMVLTNPASPLLNRGTNARYAPGSTFKPVTLLAGLETGTIAPGDRVLCEGALRIGNRVFGCWNKHGHGMLDAPAALRQSCDVWFYIRGMATGVESIARFATAFGLGAPTGWDGDDEQAGLVPTPAWKLKLSAKRGGGRWYDGDTAQMAIGQSFLVTTPLQMACLAAALANRGTVWRPFVVKRVVAPTGAVMQETKPEVHQRVPAKPQNMELVRQAMLGAIQSADGTGHSAAVKRWSVAGKTGTAEFDVYEKGVRVGRINQTWFIGFAPYENPQVALAVLVEDGESGGHTAAPVAGRILAGTFGTAAEKVAKSGAYAD